MPRRLARAGLQGRRSGATRQPPGQGSHAALQRARRRGRRVGGSHARARWRGRRVRSHVALAVRVAPGGARRPRSRPRRCLMVFDCLYARGKDLRERPLHVRRHVLEAGAGGPVAHSTGPAPGRRRAEGVAGCLSARLRRPGGQGSALAHVGGRTLKWLKVKQHRYRVKERSWT